MAEYYSIDTSQALTHYRTKGSKNGVRLYQNPDGSYTALGAQDGGRYSQHSTGRYKTDKNYSSNANRAYRQLQRDRKKAGEVASEGAYVKAAKEAGLKGVTLSYGPDNTYNVNVDKYLAKNADKIAAAEKFLEDTKYTRILMDLLDPDTLKNFQLRQEDAIREKYSKESMEADTIEATDEVSEIIANGAGRNVDDAGEAVYKSVEAYIIAAGKAEQLYSDWNKLDSLEKLNYEVTAGLAWAITYNHGNVDGDDTRYQDISMADVAHIAAVNSNFTDGDGGDGMMVWAYDSNRSSEVKEIADNYNYSHNKLWGAIKNDDAGEHFSTFTSAKNALKKYTSAEARSVIGACDLTPNYEKEKSSVALANKVVEKLPAASNNGISGWQAFNKVMQKSQFRNMDPDDLSDADWKAINAEIAKLTK